jgi:CopG family nickel-responsive transcriptional regulator
MLERFGVSMEDELLAKFDGLCRERGYGSRSEAIRDLIRRELVGEEWKDSDEEVMGTITLVYDHHAHELSHVLTDFQHKYYASIVCATHVHVDEDNCLEVIIIRGLSQHIRQIADRLISIRGVKHGQLVCTTTGKQGL